MASHPLLLMKLDGNRAFGAAFGGLAAAVAIELVLGAVCCCAGA